MREEFRRGDRTAVREDGAGQYRRLTEMVSQVLSELRALRVLIQEMKNENKTENG